MFAITSQANREHGDEIRPSCLIRRCCCKEFGPSHSNPAKGIAAPAAFRNAFAPWSLEFSSSPLKQPCSSRVCLFIDVLPGCASLCYDRDQRMNRDYNCQVWVLWKESGARGDFRHHGAGQSIGGWFKGCGSILGASSPSADHGICGQHGPPDISRVGHKVFAARLSQARVMGDSAGAEAWLCRDAVLDQADGRSSIDCEGEGGDGQVDNVAGTETGRAWPDDCADPTGEARSTGALLLPPGMRGV